MVCALQPVTCGLAVNNPVEKRRYMRITAGFLWIACGFKKEQNNSGKALARHSPGRVEMLSPQETGTTPGQLGGRAGGRETGIPNGCLALAGGSGASGKPGNWPIRCEHQGSRATGRSDVCAEEAGQLAYPVRRNLARPPPSHTWGGPCFILPDSAVFARSDTREFASLPSPRNRRAGEWPHGAGLPVGSAGSSADTRQPPAGVGPEVRRPPQAATRSRIPARPKPPRTAPGLTAPGRTAPAAAARSRYRPPLRRRSR